MGIMSTIGYEQCEVCEGEGRPVVHLVSASETLDADVWACRGCLIKAIVTLDSEHPPKDEAQPKAEPAAEERREILREPVAVCVCGHALDLHDPTTHQCLGCECTELRAEYRPAVAEPAAPVPRNQADCSGYCSECHEPCQHGPVSEE